MKRINLLAALIVMVVMAVGCWGQGSFSGSSAFTFNPHPYRALGYSAIFLLAAQSADTATTMRGQGRELNPIPHPTAIAWASTSALLGVEWALRNHPRISRALTYLNIGLGIEHGYAGVHNAMQ